MSKLANPALRARVEALGLVPKDATACQVRDAVLTALGDERITTGELSKLLEPDTTNKTAQQGKKTVTQPNPLFGSIRVKGASEAYSTTKSVAKHAKTGKPVHFAGKAVETPSALEVAKFGAYFKFLAQKAGRPVILTDHERGLLQDMIEHDAWGGEINGREYEKAAPEMVKALLFDTTSGGQFLSPYFVDDLFIQFPLLHSELLPRVQTVEVPAGTTVFGGSLGNPTVVWNTAPGSAQTEFDTTGLAAQLNTTIFPVMSWLTVGRDWMSDTPANAGAMLVENIGQVMLKELDKVIAVGDGTNQPQGIFNASGLTAVASDFGVSGPPTVGDYESLLFAVGKQYRGEGMECAFIANDTSYRRARGIPVGPGDERRVFGMEHQEYSILEYPYAVQNDIGNSQIAFGALSKYRLYRRMGSSVTWVSGTDATLMSKNLDALFVRARFGGRVTDSNAFAVTTDAQA